MLAPTLVLIFPEFQIIIFQSIQQGEPKLNTVRVGAGASTQLTTVLGFNFGNFENVSLFLFRTLFRPHPKRGESIKIFYNWGLCHLASFSSEMVSYSGIRNHSSQRACHIRTRATAWAHPGGASHSAAQSFHVLKGLPHQTRSHHKRLHQTLLKIYGKLCRRRLRSGYLEFSSYKTTIEGSGVFVSVAVGE